MARNSKNNDQNQENYSESQYDEPMYSSFYHKEMLDSNIHKNFCLSMNYFNLNHNCTNLIINNFPFNYI